MGLLSPRLPWELAQTKWAATLNPIVSNPILSGLQINNIVLAANTPKTINHLLQRLPQGWFIVDINADTSIWRTENYNQYNITLESSADVTISFWIY